MCESANGARFTLMNRGCGSVCRSIIRALLKNLLQGTDLRRLFKKSLIALLQIIEGSSGRSRLAADKYLLDYWSRVSA
jgi:hypothetical protein